MPVILNVTGPHQIAWANAGTTPTTAYLGRADNDDLFNIEMEYKYSDVFTNELGQSPANAIIMGATAFVNFSLVTHDPTAVKNMFERLDAYATTGNYVFPTVGTKIYDSTLANSSLVSLKVIPDIVNSPAYTVDRCRLISHTVKDVGNKPTRVGFRFEILAGSANATIYTVS
jgi:hypothetical protein